MRLLYLAAGAGRMFCGSCLRDGALAAALTRQGHDVLFVPLYTPLRIEAESVAVPEVFYGGVNVYLQQKSALFRRTPRWLDWIFDRARLLRFVSRFSHLTAARELAGLTISVLRGEQGAQRKELDRLLAWLEQQPRPDAVVLSNTLLSGLTRSLKGRLGAPVLSMLSGEDLFIEEFPDPWRSQAREALRGAAAGCDGFIGFNRYYAGFMAGFLGQSPDRFHVIPLGIDIRDFPSEPQRPPRPDVFTIGFLARVCPQKGLRELVEAFHRLKQKSPTQRCRLRVAGFLGGEYSGYMDQILGDVRRWGLSGDFEWAGELDRQQKIRFLSTVSCFSIPAIQPDSKGQPVAEALAAGTPVVLSRLGCFPEWVEATGGGVLCEPRDPAALAEALAGLMADPAKQRQLGESGRAAILARFTVETMAEALVRELLSIKGK